MDMRLNGLVRHSQSLTPLSDTIYRGDMRTSITRDFVNSTLMFIGFFGWYFHRYEPPKSG